MAETKKIHKLSVFFFRRDLRLEDNTGLFHALRLSEQVVPCFMFDTDQIDRSKNAYFSDNCVQFMIESLKEVNKDLEKHKSRIFFFHGEKKDTYTKMIKNIKPNAIFINEDYTAYATKRDKILEDLCNENDVKFYSYHDYTLLPKDRVMTNKGFYQKFTPYYNYAQKYEVRHPEKNNFTNYYPAKEEFKGEFDANKMDDFYEENDKIEVHGGRSHGLEILNNIKKWKDYAKKRDFLNYETTHLSAFNKFGCVSIREVYYAIQKAFGSGAELIRQLYWRDFYYYVGFYTPHVYGDAFRKEYQSIYFSSTSENLQKWKDGQTGCPIVDAAMRQLKTTGYMGNRLRMVTATYLVKDLLIDWRKGEQHFANNLIDYDPAQNNGNWQWVAGCGADNQPYFRVFNPKLQSEKFDKDCSFILDWVPELKGVDPKHIHNWDECYEQYKGKVKYPAPIVKHDIQKKKCIELYKKGLAGEKLSEDNFANDGSAEEEKEEEEDGEMEEEDDDEEEKENKKSQKERPKKVAKKRKAEDELHPETKRVKVNGPAIKKVSKKKNDSDGKIEIKIKKK